MTSGHEPLHVLVVDDELLLRWSLCEVLRRHGHTAVDAANASNASRALSDATDKFDVVLLDYRLPDTQGLELLRDIRTRLPRTAVVLMTAYGTPEVVQEALDLGAHAVVTKPFDMNAVEEMVQNAHLGWRPA